MNLLSPVTATEAGDMIAGALRSPEIDYLHVRGLAFHEMDPDARRQYIREISRRMGELSLTTADPDSDVWELNGLTSPSSQRIPYHTDNPFKDPPEEVVGFWNVRSSGDDGENIILPRGRLHDLADTRPDVAELLDELIDTPVTFEGEGKTATGLILDPEHGTVRFDRRYVVGEGAIRLASRVTELLESGDLPGDPVILQPGDALFFKNNRVLHARGPYSNPDRLNLRTRVTQLSAS